MTNLEKCEVRSHNKMR